jgi:hypothetical protein
VGKRACPPENTGGPWGFQDLLEAVRNPKHPDHEEFKDYLDSDWDSEAFDLKAVNARLRFDFAPRKPQTGKKPARVWMPPGSRD